MAQRTLEEIQTSILLKKSETESLNALEVLTNSEKQTLGNVTSSSKVAIWRLWVFIQSFAIWLHEAIFEAHKAEINDLISLNKIHTARWYRQEALKFQLGFVFPETGVYNNEGVDEALVLQSQIIKQASVEEIAGRLKIKVASEDSSGNLIPLTSTQLPAFAQYVKLYKDAGTLVEIISREPDEIRLSIDVYFDPLVLDLNGSRLDGTSETPVLDQIQEFLYNLEFNGEFLTDNFESYIRQLEGVQLIGLNEIQARFGTNSYQDINEIYIADSGYMILDVNNSNFNYIPREVF